MTEVKVDELVIGKYQRMPDRTEKEMAEFTANVKIHGVRDPIYIDEQQTVIDGHTRVLAARQCKIPSIKAIILRGLSETEKVERAYGQSHRRHLSRKQLREIVIAAIKEFPGHSPAYVAKFAPASDVTITKLRAELIAAGKIANATELLGLDGKMHPVEKKTGSQSSKPQRQQQQQAPILGTLKTGRKCVTIESAEIKKIQAIGQVRIFQTTYSQKEVRQLIHQGINCLLLAAQKAANPANGKA